MISKNPKAFSMTAHGYEPAEVDAYIETLLEAYEDLSLKNERLSNALAEATEKGDAIVEEAYLKADEILASVKGGCDSILRNFRDKVEAQRKIMEEMQEALLCFKNELFEKYRLHIELIERIAPVHDENDWLAPDDCLERAAEELKRDIEAQYGLMLESQEITVPKNEEPRPQKTRTARSAEKTARPMGKASAQKQLSVKELLEEYEEQNAFRKAKNVCEEQFALNFDGGSLK